MSMQLFTFQNIGLHQYTLTKSVRNWPVKMSFLKLKRPTVWLEILHSSSPRKMSSLNTKENAINEKHNFNLDESQLQTTVRVSIQYTHLLNHVLVPQKIHRQ